MPDSADNYQLPSWPPTPIDRDLWNAVMASIGNRLTAREGLEANFEALIAEGTQASLDYIQATVAPQIATLQATISLAQQQIDQIVIDGISPNSLKLGGQLPAYYATAAALAAGLADRVPTTRTVAGKPLSADVTLVKADVGLGNVDNTPDADKPVSTAQAAAIAAVVAGHSLLAGHRNKIINGDSRLRTRGDSQTTAGYGSDDRWYNHHVGSAKTHSLQPFAPGQTNVPGEPALYSRTVVTSVAGAGNYVLRMQAIESVRTLAGQLATVTFWARADSSKNIAVELVQNFGTGGSPSAQVTAIGVRKLLLSSLWQKFTFTVAIPSITGKTIGTATDGYLGLTFWFDAGSNWNGRTLSLGQQSGTFDLADISLVAGDATMEINPSARRHVAEEERLCRRYGRWLHANRVTWQGDGNIYTLNIPIEPMRVAPTVLNGGTIQTNNLSGYPYLTAINNSTVQLVSATAGVGPVTAQVNAYLDAEIY